MKDNMISIKNMKVHFELAQGMSFKFLKHDKAKKKVVKAVDGISLDIKKGEILSLVGESGSGKTTTGKAILQLVNSQWDEGWFEGQPIDKTSKSFMKEFRQKAQMIYQDPYQSLNPRDRILDIVAEPLDVNGMVKTEEERVARVKIALEQAGLNPAESFYDRYPYELSGGQRQRVVIASSMIMKPSFVVADEPVSMLDASVRTGILKLMLELRNLHQLSYLFITHDLSLAWLISDRIAIMYLGQIMEIGTAHNVMKEGKHPYTQALTAIMPKPGVKITGERPTLIGEVPDPSDIKAGCKFSNRCPKAKPLCFETVPELKPFSEVHFVACHFAE